MVYEGYDKEPAMLPVARIGLSSSSRAVFRAVIVGLAWLALWFSVLVATLDRPAARETNAVIGIAAAPRA
jgi:hypothetical protein